MDEQERERIRAIDRVRKAERRKKGRKEDEEKVRAQNRERMKNDRAKLNRKQSDKVKITDLIRKRKNRLMETEGEKKCARNKAKIGMRVLRKEGPMRKYEKILVTKSYV